MDGISNLTRPYIPATSTGTRQIDSTKKEPSSEEQVQLQKPSLDSTTSSIARVVIEENGKRRILEGPEAEEYINAQMACMEFMAAALFTTMFAPAMAQILSDPKMVEYFEETAKRDPSAFQTSDRVEELDTPPKTTGKQKRSADDAELGPLMRELSLDPPKDKATQKEPASSFKV